ncbi:COPII coat assembly protein SEC16-like isoform X2 [Python bivittatus]|uniref:COPII coat assembly protein SEC16-like isoform X2 n=1 Tax=Python bivittatus TaxID=176946 RepID=A0A9F2R050_PYTBI|nr:COPII coat assembly protein SEC16-like isoform X2 [Python bivittatus]
MTRLSTVPKGAAWPESLQIPCCCSVLKSCPTLRDSLADQNRNSWAAEDQDLPPPSCPTTDASTTGGEPEDGSGTESPGLNKLSGQPPILNLPAQQTPGNASSQSYLPPGASYTPNILGEEPGLPLSAVREPPESAWKSEDPPQNFYAPLPPPDRNPATGPMERPHLRYLPCLQLPQKQPQERRANRPTSLQDKSSLYNHGTLGLIPSGERNPTPRPGRSAPVLPSPTSQVVLGLKEVEPHISQTSVPAGPARPSSGDASPADPKEMDVQAEPEKKHYPSPSCSENEGTLLLAYIDEFHVQQEVLIELVDMQTAEGIVFQQSPSKFFFPDNAAGAGLSRRDGDQSQDLPRLATGTLGIASSTEADVDPLRSKLPPMPTSRGKGEVIGLCRSHKDLKNVTRGQHSDSLTARPATKQPDETSAETRPDYSLFVLGTKVKMSGRVVAPGRNHQEKKQDAATMKTSGDKKSHNRERNRVRRS